MTLPAPTYDLVLLLDPEVDETVRTKLVADTRKAIDAQGEVLRHDEWGNRAMTYPIDRKTHAEYHLLQFHAGAPDLLDGLDRTLRLADDVLRFRIIKLAPGVPEAPDMSAPAAPPRRSEAEAPAEPAPEPTDSEAEAPVEPAAEAAEAEVPAEPASPEVEASAEDAAEMAASESS